MTARQVDDPYEWLRKWAEDIEADGPGELFGPACDAIHALEALDALRMRVRGLRDRLGAMADTNEGEYDLVIIALNEILDGTR